jgi:hypothetical protein
LGTASDTGDLKITGIIENVSEAYFKAPSQYKEIITARRQSANVPSFANILTGGRFIANFYEDQIIFLETTILSVLLQIIQQLTTIITLKIRSRLTTKIYLRYTLNPMIRLIRGS